MSLFVQVGAHWINLELVASIEFVDPPTPPPGSAPIARIHFTTGKQQDFYDQAQVKDLVDFLRRHKAT